MAGIKIMPTIRKLQLEESEFAGLKGKEPKR